MAADQKREHKPKRESSKYQLNFIILAHQMRIALPFIANFAAGAIAGISEILTFYPLGIFLVYQVCLTKFTALSRCRMCYSSCQVWSPEHVLGQNADAAGHRQV